ncbi:Acidic fibroblast growth factor intracellular binding protein [Paragonimus westermani]|uniref:Acidic fibroblast growth factor intracellular binding protein n=1 Tax=Paragonimus westermani TaxID=34504 RepID=A0A8T0DBJ1_9TREM|nr:Acidic fibroblast growth factor intracellular binding protein [Paragonimus westermani]
MYQHSVFLWTILCLLYSTESAKPVFSSNLTYLYLVLPHNAPKEDQYRARVGFERGLIGSEKFAVVMPPLHVKKPLMRIGFYRPESTDVCANRAFKNHSSIEVMYKHYKEKTAILKSYEKASENLAELIKPFVVSEPESRSQFIMFSCLFRGSFENVGDFRERRHSVLPHVHRYCPSVCGNREGPGMDEVKRSQLNRYNNPCSYPPTYSLFVSRKCVEPTFRPVTHQQGFMCECMQGAKWLSHSKACASSLSTANLGCSAYGTSHVTWVEVSLPDDLFDRTTSSSHYVMRCICKPQYYGTYCNQQKDPCSMSIGEALPGNVACLVSKGNLCIPDRLTNRYICKCTRRYGRIPAAQFPPGRLLDNCLREVDPCSLKACMHGTCVLSDAGVTLKMEGKRDHEPFQWTDRTPAIVARCLCNVGWTGETCEHPLVLNGWTPWSPWSSCEPKCQTSFQQLPPTAISEMVPSGESTPRWGVRQRTRYRDCIGQSSDCRQEMLERSADMGLRIEDGELWRQYERRACRPRPCDRHLYLAMSKRTLKRPRIQKEVVRCF